MSLDHRSPIPLYHQIEQAVTQFILEQQLAPGTRLPSETELAQRFNVAPLTVRRGLERLERDGIIVRRRGSGTFVGANMPARSAQPSGRICFILHDPNSPLLLGLMHSIEGVLRETGRQTLVTFGGFDDALECQRIREAAADALGLILWSECGPLATAEIARLHAENFPVVLVDRCPPGLGVDCVLVDDASGAHATARHLLDLGHRQIAFLYGPEPLELSSVTARLGALRETLHLSGLPDDALSVHYHPCMVTQENLDTTLELARGLLAGRPQPSAIFCVNDALAQALAVSLARLGVSVPAEISLTGFDGLHYLPTGQRLTTVRRDAGQMGREAARLLSERIANPGLPVRRLILPVEFSPGETSGPPNPPPQE